MKLKPTHQEGPCCPTMPQHASIRTRQQLIFVIISPDGYVTVHILVDLNLCTMHFCPIILVDLTLSAMGWICDMCTYWWT